MASFPEGQEQLALTDFQVQVARLFFSLPEAAGFLLAGGAGLVAQHLTTRPGLDHREVPGRGDLFVTPNADPIRVVIHS